MAFKRIWHQAEVLAALDAGVMLVTSGERLARAARLAHGEARHAAGVPVWERPAIHSYGAFIDFLYDTAADGALSLPGRALPRRISEAAVESRWEEAVRDSSRGGALLQPAAAAREAARAWTLVNAYRIPLELIAAGDEDAQAFAAWAEHYTAASRRQGWLEDARLADWLATQLRSRSLPAPPRLIFAGFDEFTPQEQELIASLRAGGSDVRILEAGGPSRNGALRRVEQDPEAEMRAAAGWARALLEQQPDASIGIVVRDLAACRAALARALDDALCPAAATGRPVARPYDLSLGLPLDSSPPVHAALAALELLGRRAAFLTVSLLLRSPFLGGAEGEHAARATLELRLRERVSEHVSLKALIAFSASAHVPRLLAHLNSLRDKAAELPARQRPSAWARDFADALNRLGWPGERLLDSSEFQAVTALRELIGTLVHLDAALGPVTLPEALTRLRRLAAEHIFQPAGADAPVQVVGLLETAGLAFDHLWVMGLTDDTWPAGPRPTAFIPPRLQREFRVPHASAVLELEFAQRLTTRLLASAPQVVASSAAAEGDTPLRPSPLIAPLPEAAVSVFAAVQPFRTRLRAEHARAMERHADMRAPALRPGEPARGGTQLIRSQATCPFQSFALHRLGTKPLEEPAFGPDALERGSLVHEVLEAVWKELKDHAGLVALAEHARRALVERCAAKVVDERARQLPDVYTPRVAELERERLAARVSLWLSYEAARPPFRVVESESEHQLVLGKLTLRTRVDRIDELPDGGRLIIDYKTGQVDVGSWLEPRPDEPQLPLYAVARAEGLAGVAFACLKPGEMRLAGLAARQGVAAGIVHYPERKDRPAEAPDWPGLLSYWQANLATLAEEYAGGDARVQPKTAEACKRCHLSMLCRIHEMVAPEDDDGT